MAREPISPFYILPDSGLVRGASTTLVHERLFVSSRPPAGANLAEYFDALVLCAREHQRTDDYRDVTVLTCLLDDSGPGPTPAEILRANAMAGIVARRVAGGQTVLVSCAMGINRSAWVAALAIRRLLGVRGTDARRIVQLARPGTLRNEHFAAMLDGLPAPSMALQPRVADLAPFAAEEGEG